MHLPVALVLAVPYALLVALTAIGSVRRGLPGWLAVGTGLIFPATWVVWYVRDGGLRDRTHGSY